MHRQIKPPAYMVATTKLSQDWSANRCVSHISSDWLDELLADERFSSMDPMVKIRLLLAGLLALDERPASPVGQQHQQEQQQGEARSDLRASLQQLRRAVGADADEWAKIMAAAAGELDGRLDLDAIMRQSAVVQESLSSLGPQVEASNNQDLLPPLQAMFLQDPPSVLRPDAGHFVVRHNPRVQPLAGGCSYTQATPPPPALTGGHHHHGLGQPQQHGGQGATFLRPTQLKQQQVAAAAGRVAPGGAAAGVAAAAASGLSRSRSAQLQERQHGVQLLDAEEQASLFHNTQLKHGKGVASAVRHEALVWQKPPRRTAKEEQLEDEGHAQQQHEPPPGNPRGRRGAAAAADAAAGRAGSRQGNDQWGPSVAEEREPTDSDIEELFDDEADGFDVELSAPAPTGASKSVKQSLAHRQLGSRAVSEEHEVTPDELMDDFDVEEGQQQPAIGAGTGQQARAAAGRDVHQQQQHQASEAVSVAVAKRRRVIQEDSEDDD